MVIIRTARSDKVSLGDKCLRNINCYNYERVLVLGFGHELRLALVLAPDSDHVLADLNRPL